MRKFIFFLLLIPAFASLGHDIYIFQQNPDKGFRLSALGALWDKYHKESHDQWKSKVREMGENIVETVDDLVDDELIESIIKSDNTKTDQAISNGNKPAFMEEFSQSDSKDKGTEIKPLPKEDKVDTKTNGLIKFIGFILEQKAVIFFSAIAAIAFILNAILRLLFRPKEGMDKVKSVKRVKNKGKRRMGDSYNYGRK